MKGEEKSIKGNEPFTHIFYFSAKLNTRGRITEDIERPEVVLKDGCKPKIHLVIAELSNPSLMHFSLNPSYDVRDWLIEDICRVSRDYDGIQIDFESVLAGDAENFRSFLSELKSRIPGKTLSIAVPARAKAVDDAYSYREIAGIVDKIVIMAYDEHWSNSSPGPVASLPWCSKVAAYAKKEIDADKIIMGLPLYGRAWQDKKLAKAMRFNHVNDLIRRRNLSALNKPDLGPHFKYSEKVSVSVYYDDHNSISKKLNLYMSEGIKSVSFWRIGQEPANLWDGIQNSSDNMIQSVSN